MKYLITSNPGPYNRLQGITFKLGTLEDFFNWLSIQDELIQLDTETTMVDDGPNSDDDRELLLMQFGDYNKQTQWLIDWTMFDNEELKRILKTIFATTGKRFIAHNARFEYKVIKSRFGFGVENIEDTYLMSRVLNTGLELERGYHSLAGCLKRFGFADLDKAAQTTFSKEPMSLEQIEYAALDVMFLYDLYMKFKELLEGWNLWKVYSVERQVMKVYADMEMSPMQFDREYWDELSEELRQDDARLEQELNELVLSDPKLVVYIKANSHRALKEHLIQPYDELQVNWASNVTRKAVLTRIIPNLQGRDKFTKPELKKLAKSEVLKGKEQKLLWYYLDREFDVLNRYLQLYHRDWLIENGFYVPENTIRINWASSVHKLFIFQFYYPNLENTNAKTLARIYTNPLINKFKEYTKVHKYLTTYGPSFVNKYVRRDGTIAPQGISQILNTGRIAFGILLQMPGQARFRNAFLPPEKDWVFVDSDYSSAEVAIMAYAAGETAFLDAIKEGKDLHMMSASLIFADKWEEIAEPGCKHLVDGSKCDCVEHNKLRKQSKAITFGLAYGLSHIGLAERLDISRKEAQELMEKFFETFSHLKKFFDTNAELGKKQNYIQGLPPTRRIRFFHAPLNEGERSAIGRQSMNYPIQEANASMLKIALILMRNEIREKSLPVILHLPVHDEVLSSCPKDYAEEWLKIQEKCMENAADMFLEPGLLGVDSDILKRWTK